MRKMILALGLLLAGAGLFAQNRNWDRPIQVKKMFMQVKADPFTATTFLEIEFYNPNDTEIEGLYHFQLQPGQAITAFQLDLNGKYRDGSIEEKWKAANAYNRVVGKRIDPALLQMDGNNSYSLRIYPIQGRNSRKITLTVQQLMKTGKETIDYFFPLSIGHVVEEFRLNIEVNGSSLPPFVKQGLLKDESFNGAFGQYALKMHEKVFLPDKPVSFHIPLSNETVYCTLEKDGEKFFAVNYKPQAVKPYAIQPGKLTVFWDVSASGLKRDVAREISFLKQYLAYHNIPQLTIISFNHRIQDTAEFFTENGFNSRWDQYLRALTYDGATQLGCIDLSKLRSDVVFIFSDGLSSYGREEPKPGTPYVFCIASSLSNGSQLGKMVDESGGACIDLKKTTVSEAIRLASQARNVLMDIRSASGKSILNDEVYDASSGNLLLWGTTRNQARDSLLFIYGNSNHIHSTDVVILDGSHNCSGSAINRMDALHQFTSIVSSGDWQKMLLFGRQQRIVTMNTSYIVLERIEDYITYNIEPPRELEEECEKRGFVKKDNTKILRQLNEADILQGVVNFYNIRINKWKPGSENLKYSAEYPLANNQSKAGEARLLDGFLRERAGMDEVVVIGMALRKDLTGSVSVIRQQDLFVGAGTIEQALAGKVSGLQITPSPGTPGTSPVINIRGISTVRGNNQPLIVLDGLAVSGDINSFINVNDIESVTVLKDAAATAIYGSRAINGVLVIKSKHGGDSHPYYSNQSYKLKNQEDVDYLAELKACTKSGKLALYQQLREIYGQSPGFYFDMAQHLFESGFKKEAMTVLANAAEVSGGNIAVLNAMGFVLEEWQEYGEAITLFEQVKKLTGEIQSARNLAWANYKNGNVQKAVDLLYQAVVSDWGSQEAMLKPVKAMMLDELSCMVQLHKDHVNLSGINLSLIRTLPVALRLVIDGNIRGIPGNVTIIEPGGEKATLYGNNKSSGYINSELSGYSGEVEYLVKQAKKGTYHIRINYYDHYRNRVDIPVFVRITCFRNFGSADQTIEIQNVIMDNQNGDIEIGEIRH